MVILSMMYALSELVSKSEPLDKLDVTLDISELLMVIKREGQLGIFTIRRDHVFRSSETYKMLAMRFHPDRAGRDTTEEMQIINHYKNTGLRMEMREAA
ncbi:MAG: hypothetical protein QOG66_2686 [Methylobacteriaceae bacterium]|nr:hypothetical protein [Methylobacteriaceae bacterium]